MSPQVITVNRCETTAWMTLRWIRGTRYVRAHLEQDLWSAWLVTHVNGRVGSPLGRVRTRPSPSLEGALLELTAIAKRRRQRGYALTNQT